MNRKELKRMIQQEIARVREDLLVGPDEVPDDFMRIARPGPAHSSAVACPACGESPCSCDDLGMECPACMQSPCQCASSRDPYRLSCTECGSVMVMQEGCGCGGSSASQAEMMPVMSAHDDFESEYEFGTAHHEGAYMAKAQLHKIEKYSSEIQHMIPPGHDLEDWMRTKISQAADDLGEVYHKLEYMHHKD